MKPQYMPKNGDQCREYLIEEMGELLAALGKAGRWGYASTNPEIPVEQRETNAEWIEREMVDVRRALDMFTPYLKNEIKRMCVIAEQQRATAATDWKERT